ACQFPSAINSPRQLHMNSQRTLSREPNSDASAQVTSSPIVKTAPAATAQTASTPERPATRARAPKERSRASEEPPRAAAASAPAVRELEPVPDASPPGDTLRREARYRYLLLAGDILACAFGVVAAAGLGKTTHLTVQAALLVLLAPGV